MGTGVEGKRAAAIVAAVVGALLWIGLAASAPGDPKRKLNAADQAYARSFVLRKAELPAGSWRAKPTDFNQSNPPCLVKHYSFSALTVTGEAGLTFTAGGGIPVVESDAHVFPSAAQARRGYALESKLGLARCGGSAIAAGISKAAPGTTATVEKIERLRVAGLAAAANGFRVAIRVRSPQVEIPLDVVFVALSRGRALASLSLVRAGAPWPPAAVRSLAAAMAGRMAKR